MDLKASEDMISIKLKTDELHNADEEANSLI